MRFFHVISFILFVGMVIVYFIPFNHGVVDVRVSVFPFMVLVMVCAWFVLVFTIFMLLYVLPACMGSLNVMVIALLVATLLALFVGSVVVMVGGVVSATLLHLKLIVNALAKVLPERSVILLTGTVSW